MKKKLALISIILTNLTCANAASVWRDSFTADKFSMNIASGVLINGKGKEFVNMNDPARQISRLEWDINNTPILKADFGWDVLPWLSVAARGWTTASSGKSLMNDYDWQDGDDSNNLTDWSNHPNTNLNFANEFDFNVKAWVLNQPQYKLGTIIGYQQNRFSWVAHGGSYQYSDDSGEDGYVPGSSLSNYGEFEEGVAVVAYKQQYDTPYLGLIGQYRYQAFELNAAVKYSPWVKAKDQDRHYLADKTTYSKGGTSDFYSASVDLGYYVVPTTKLYAEYNWTEFKDSKTKMTNVSMSSGEVSPLEGFSGKLTNKFQTINIGIAHHF